jgi:phosphoenolpyruvate carboxylase
MRQEQIGLGKGSERLCDGDGGKMRTCPRTMSTQHPDNVTTPFFAESSIVRGDDEVKEAYYVFSHLSCHEQMWDYEGKEVDNFVVKKLLSRYEHFFRENILGKDCFITLRVPNPSWERAEAKVLLETLESIPRSFDAAKLFYGEDIAPIFEVILPMTTSSVELNRIYHYYKNFVVEKQNKPFFRNDATIAEWIGEFKPREINVIPLMEDMPYILSCHEIVEGYLADKRIEHQRVFLAKSDLALNYGMLASTLALKIALIQLEELEERTSVGLYPIIGFGSAPFRGNLRPNTARRIIEEWVSVQTFTIQSAFKYDYPERDVKNAIETINSTKKGKCKVIDKNMAVEVIKKSSKEYRKNVLALANLINKIASFVPKRRERKLHIGLFGYSRVVNGTTLPRAIPFCCALYSIGLPPEILGFNLREKELDFVFEALQFENDLKDSLKYFNPRVLKIIPKELSPRIDLVDFEIDEAHRAITDEVIGSLKKGNLDLLQEKIVQAANIRKFLG